MFIELLRNLIGIRRRAQEFLVRLSIDSNININIKAIVHLKEVRSSKRSVVKDDGRQLRSSALGDDFAIERERDISASHR